MEAGATWFLSHHNFKGNRNSSISKNAFLEIEALNYELYPYKYEIQRVLKGDYMAPNAIEILLLEDYFLSLEKSQMQTIVIDI